MKLREYKVALREGLPKEIVDKLYQEWEELEKANMKFQDKPMFQVSGFSHPPLYTLIKDTDYHATRFTWGLAPNWVKEPQQAKEIMTKTLNARGETIFEKPSFRDSAKNKRCLIFVDGFYEHHHQKGKTYPYFIHHKEENRPLVLGGLWAEWTDKNTGEIFSTASIVTTEGNSMMAKIHNNPKADGARMPLILDPEEFEMWLTSKDKAEVEKMIKPYPQEKLEAHTVGKLNGKEAVVDSAQSIERLEYAELKD